MRMVYYGLLLLKAQEKEESLARTADAVKAGWEVDCFNKSEGTKFQQRVLDEFPPLLL